MKHIFSLREDACVVLQGMPEILVISNTMKDTIGNFEGASRGKAREWVAMGQATVGEFFHHQKLLSLADTFST